MQLSQRGSEVKRGEIWSLAAGGGRIRTETNNQKKTFSNKAPKKEVQLRNITWSSHWWYEWSNIDVMHIDSSLRERWGQVRTWDISHLLSCFWFLQCRWGFARLSGDSFTKAPTLLQCISVLKLTPKEAPPCCLCNRGKRHTPCCVPQPTFTPVFIYIARPSCRPLIGFAWVMSTIDRKYNLIRSHERRRWDGRYWNRMGMATNGTTPSQCSIIAIWFINYPWRWGFYLPRHANWQRRHTRACTLTKKGNILYHGEACLPSAWWWSLWRAAGLYVWTVKRRCDWRFIKLKTQTPPNISDLKYTHDYFIGGEGKVGVDCSLLSAAVMAGSDIASMRQLEENKNKIPL